MARGHQQGRHHHRVSAHAATHALAPAARPHRFSGFASSRDKCRDVFLKVGNHIDAGQIESWIESYTWLVRVLRRGPRNLLWKGLFLQREITGASHTEDFGYLATPTMLRRGATSTTKINIWCVCCYAWSR